MSERREAPEYTCPACGTLSEQIISPEQAFCTNIDTCALIAFNPMYHYTEADTLSVYVIDFRAEEQEREP